MLEFVAIQRQDNKHWAIPGVSHGSGAERTRLQQFCRLLQGTHGTEKTGKMTKKNPCQGKHREFGNFAKTQGSLFAQVVNSLILKVKDTAIFAAKISIFFPRSWIGLPSQFCLCNIHKLCKLAQGKLAIGQGKHREFENTI